MRSKIIYEDDEVIVVHKPAGMATQTKKLREQDLVSEIKNYLSMQSRKAPFVGLINRLDQPVEGIVLLAKKEYAAAALGNQITQNKMKKFYCAAVYGILEPREGSLENYMMKDAATNLSKIVPKDPQNKNVKYAELKYQFIENVDNDLEIVEESVKSQVSYIKIQLLTGRHHQIRVQFAHQGYPLLGDMKYGTTESIAVSRLLGVDKVALCAYRLVFLHPKTKKEMRMQIEPGNSIFQKIELSERQEVPV